MIQRLQKLNGWRRLAVSLALGALATMALPPLYFFPVLALSFSGLIWLLDGVRRARTALAIGWWFGFGYFAAGLYWTGFAMLVDAARFAWLVPIASLGLPAGLAIFSGLAGLIYYRLGPTGVARVLVLALAWTTVEWLRSTILTGFPWNLIGYTWMSSDAMAQAAAYVGVHGLGLITVATMASFAAIKADGSALSRFRYPLVGIAVLAIIQAGGTWRVANTKITNVEGVNLRLVQANIPQHHKWRPELRRKNLDRYMQMSSFPGADRISHIIWPETAAAYFLGNDPELRKSLGGLVAGNGVLITGAPRTTPTRQTPFKVWNSVLALDNKGDIVGTYDKFHLVPFGEYVPFRNILGLFGIERLVAGRGDFQRGPGPRTLELPGLPPVSPLICYEAIFPGEVKDPDHRPDWMLNLTNDAWFGMTAGPHQHLAMTRMRAIEEGIAMVRVANTGISAIIDPLGRVRNSIGLGVSGVLDGTLPRPVAEATLYSRYADRTALVVFLIALAVCGGLMRRRGEEQI